MNDPVQGFAAGFLLAWGLMMVLGILISRAEVSANEREIVKHRAGRYVLDPKTGNSTFHWNDEAPESAEKAGTP